ncbi:CaiB/BaiF CoA transferase family protein [Candidatus Puniceispirillum marinum]|uniref:L-carnitine dehydratase/bile acid-inducible protein F n=1 Tax=Puniceispirillum marinum (strain IMCC1322) TaxID=488538 RepID=D5BS70_PUNMI|nr:CaiB/BaiF CoA-transferase family protein [Candidatus Puniceispirillum marinum]ADE39117.1 L-carnitine dehydratase/bile acid-inducible protein F [Candidatus Puniceispirillum marinum IMCC1322]
MSEKELDGLFVVSIEQAVAAPYASCKLADAGARVVKIERAEGDFARKYDADARGNSSYFVWLNRGKESLRLDLKDANDLAMLHRMIAKADIFIQNLMPGAIERLGFSSQSLRDTYPRLITCDISGYGSTGELSQMKAYDFLVQAEVGLAQITGAPQAPGRVGVSICDIAAGMTAYQAILQAIIARYKTGLGRGIEVSLFGALADWMNVPYLQHHYGGKTIARPGLHHPSIAPYGAYQCGDGQVILISIQNEREWKHLCTGVLGDTAIASDPRFHSNIARVENRPALDAMILSVFARHDSDAVIDLLARADIAYGRLNNLDQLASHPQSRFVTVKTSEGELELLAPGATVMGESHGFGAVPTLGEHDDTLRREFSDSKVK